MSSDYTITIQNSTGDENQSFRYIAFGFPQPTSAAVGGTGLPVVFFRSQLLNNGDQARFTLSPEVYGFFGNSSQSNTSLTAGANVSLTKQIAVQLGDSTGNGTVLEAKPKESGSGIDFHAVGLTSEEGTFRIVVNNGVPAENQYVVGVARKVDGIYNPTTVFGLNRGQRYTITPVASIYIARDNGTNTDTVVKPENFTVKQQVDLRDGQFRAAATDTSTGFTVRYN
ncbi:hypothetical protein TWF730_003773 [Orbilia blumenaviensis]|uniref:Uncharacterized protein n=1 Tax=Orbilia blumenaviensis TaxID=1796055 RepID=A0AAV9U6A2_9PEZI